jgi:hypothetical protein
MLRCHCVKSLFYRISISYHVKQKKPPKLQSTLSSEIDILKKNKIYGHKEQLKKVGKECIAEQMCILNLIAL